MDLFWNIKNYLWTDNTFYEVEFKVRYPIIDFELKPVNKDDLEAKYNLDFRNKDEKEINCKVKIQTSTDIFVEHHLLNPTKEDQTERIYESPYIPIKVNENGNCCNTIILNANTQEATAQIKVFPICNIDGTDVILKDHIISESWKHKSQKIVPRLS